MKSSIKTILKYSLLLISSLLVIMTVLVTTLRFTLLNSDYVKNEFEKNNYYKKLTTEIKTEMSYYTNQSGFTDDVLDNVFTENDVQYDFNRYINSLYTGEQFVIDTQKIEDNLNKNIEAQLKDSHFKVNTDEIKKFVKQMTTVYENEIKLMGYIDSVKNLMFKVISMCDKVLFSLVVGLVLSIFIYLKLFKTKDLSVMFYTPSMLLFFFVLYFKNSIDINNISIYSELISHIIKELLNNYLNIICLTSCSLLVLGLIIDILRKERRRHRHHHHRSSSEEV